MPDAAGGGPAADDPTADEPVPAYSFRLSLLKKERTYRLEPGALVWTEGKKSGRVPYSDVKRVHIFSMPPTMGQTIRRVILKGAFRGKLRIAATHFKGLGRFEDRSASYFPFAEALLARITAANPNVAIRAGHGWISYLFWTTMLVFIVIMLILGGIVAYTGEIKGSAIPAFVILILFLPVSLRIARNGRPRKADAGALYGSDLGGRKM